MVLPHVIVDVARKMSAVVVVDMILVDRFKEVVSCSRCIAREVSVHIG